VLLGLGLPEWLTIIGLIGGLVLTFYVMARASIAYEAKRRQRADKSHGQDEMKVNEAEEESRP
jgi:hypothetical protein